MFLTSDTQLNLLYLICIAQPRYSLNYIKLPFSGASISIFHKLLLLIECFKCHTCLLIFIICTHIGVPKLRSSITTNSTVTIQWDPAISPSGCGPILHYNVTIMNQCDAPDMNTIATNQNRAEFFGLRNGSSYDISVAAVNRVGTGPSSRIIITTLTGSEKGKL